MGKINKLPKNIWELIAAGEVVERPASVVKELLENSVDAGSTAITIEIQNGGIRYIRITDNGCGIAREDVPLAFVSHATSKISFACDLDAINTLGFRGEALSSVAAVSKTEIITKTIEENIGTRMEIEGGEQTLLDDAGCPNGTTIIIRDLFYNTPARMKFLKSDKAEGMAVAGIVDKIALSHPEISFRFIKDGKEMICTNGNGQLLDCIYSVYGKDFSDSMLPVEYEMNGIFVKGYVSKPFFARGSGSMQLFFVNNRFIKSRTASAAINEAYKNSIMVGKYPACVLFLDVISELVDVNVHPAKTQVRFSDEKSVFDSVYYSAKNAITADLSRPQMSIKQKKQTDVLAAAMPDVEQTKIVDLPVEQNNNKNYNSVISKNDKFEENNGSAKSYVNNVYSAERLIFNSTEKTVYTDKSNSEEIDLSVKTAFKQIETPKAEVVAENITGSLNNETEKTVVPAKDISFKYLGEAFSTYIFAEYNGKIIIIDKHAAHERMIYNSLKKDVGSQGSQIYLKPVSVTLSKEEYTAITENVDILNKAGFDLDDFGNGSVIVRACPLNLEKEDITEIITEIADFLINNRKEIIPEKLDWIYHSVSCRAAVKGGNKSTDYELIEFTKRLLSDDSVRYCPHGRPVLIELTKNEIEKQFGRA